MPDHRVSDRRRGLWFARLLGGVGRTMITVGTLILLFVAYQLWGTGIRTAQAQGRLEDDFAATLDAAAGGVIAGEATTTTTDPGSTSTSRLPATTAPELPPELLPARGEAAGRIVIERIGVDWIFVEGVDVADLKEGPGHYPETPLPGQSGNSGIAGHRTTYGAPFANIDQLQVGDLIEVTTVQGEFTYEVLAQPDGQPHLIVAPSAIEVLGQEFGDNRLTLTACHPKYSARQRIVVAARLVGEPAPPTPLAVPRRSGAADLSGEDVDNGPVIFWGLVCAAIWLVAWLIGKRWRRLRWPSYGVFLLPFMVGLYFFFENFSRLLPANY